MDTNDDGGALPAEVPAGKALTKRQKKYLESKETHVPGLYFIYAPKMPDIYKVGIADKTPLDDASGSRLQTLQIGNHNPIEVHAYFQVPDSRLLRRLESALQREPWMRERLTRPDSSWYRLDRQTRQRIKGFITTFLEENNNGRSTQA